MAKFKVEFEVDLLDHSETAHRRFIESALDQVKLALGRGVDTEGEIVMPAIGAVKRAVIGRWMLDEEEMT